MPRNPLANSALDSRRKKRQNDKKKAPQTCSPANLPTCLRACQPANLPAALPTCQPAYEPANLPTCLQPCQPANLPTSLPTCQPAYEPANLVTCIRKPRRRRKPIDPCGIFKIPAPLVKSISRNKHPPKGPCPQHLGGRKIPPPQTIPPIRPYQHATTRHHTPLMPPEAASKQTGQYPPAGEQGPPRSGTGSHNQAARSAAAQPTGT